MSIIDDHEFTPFLIRAKRATYAGGDAESGTRTTPSRQGSHDLVYREGPWAYLDTYLGGFSFIGEEAVWKDDRPVWGMNYYGSMTAAAGGIIPEGFSDFLKLSLRAVTPEAPYRGPAQLTQGRYTYTCRWTGSPERFRGDEQITLDGVVIYTLDFHGGLICE
ncbi:MAG: XRE family transcriptional regulator [Chloroflexi bacterium]|nr:XRE family transcriptional regulator [Chloroflexota bacterium]